MVRSERESVEVCSVVDEGVVGDDGSSGREKRENKDEGEEVVLGTVPICVGHLGESKMLERLKERFYWPSCRDAVSEWCKSCIKCATRKTTVPKARAGLQTI